MILAFTAVFVTPGSLCVFSKPTYVMVVPLIKEIVAKKKEGGIRYRAAYTFCFLKKGFPFSSEVCPDEDDGDAVVRLIENFQTVFEKNDPYFYMRLKDYVMRQGVTRKDSDTVCYLLPMTLNNINDFRKISESYMKNLLAAHQKGSPSSLSVDLKILDAIELHKGWLNLLCD